MVDDKHEADVGSRLWNIANAARERGGIYLRGGELGHFAYVAYLIRDHGLRTEDVTPEKVIDVIGSAPIGNEHRVALREIVSRDTTSLIRDLAAGFSAEELKGIVLQPEADSPTDRALGRYGDPDLPASLRSLAIDLLHIDDTDYVADLHCADGTFLMNVLRASRPARVYGSSNTALNACLAEARMSLVGAKHLIECRDGLLVEHPRTFDKIFDTPPFGMQVALLSKDATPYLKSLLDGSDPMGRPSSADWLYCRLAYDSLADGGTAVVIVANGALFNGRDIQTRRYFVDNGMIRAAIALPRKLLAITTIPLTILLLGKNDGPIRLVDATDLATPGRRTNTLSEDAVAKIEARLSQDGDKSRLVSREELAAHDYSLYAPRYFYETPDLINPVSLSDLATSIERGASIRADDLDNLTTPEDTGLYFLRLADITDGSISDDLLHLKSVDPSTERQWLRNGDLILSKNGAPFKVAVADVPDDRTILANGNLYIIRLDTERVDPYYVAAFLASEDGKRSLECRVTGTTIPNLPLRNIRDLQIPVPAMETQRRIATRYRASLDQVAILKIRLDAARDAASASYDEEMGR
ncbi:N-6 DNA methylase [Parafannyhessea umbonata]|uniref:N-6 DNA methylase n=1 Tax=Parafannyhessea umbonata TaxID=604330 RepID=UPI0026EB29FC|nr:N-6 DNA methylase [Parafannyhessea umbonata]MCI7218421.1 N-6 DNA methylase [Parafannyhessea umbonata]